MAESESGDTLQTPLKKKQNGLQRSLEAHSAIDKGDLIPMNQTMSLV